MCNECLLSQNNTLAGRHAIQHCVCNSVVRDIVEYLGNVCVTVMPVVFLYHPDVFVCIKLLDQLLKNEVYKYKQEGLAPCTLNVLILYRVAHEKPVRRLVDQRGRRSRTLYRKLNKCKCRVLTGYRRC